MHNNQPSNYIFSILDFLHKHHLRNNQPTISTYSTLDSLLEFTPSNSETLLISLDYTHEHNIVLRITIVDQMLSTPVCCVVRVPYAHTQEDNSFPSDSFRSKVVV